MKQYLYVYFNVYLSAWDKPMAQNFEPKDMAEGVRRYVMMNPDEALKARFDEKELYVIGTFDDAEGTIEITEKKCLAHCSTFFPNGFLKAHQPMQEFAYGQAGKN